MVILFLLFIDHVYFHIPFNELRIMWCVLVFWSLFSDTFSSLYFSSLLTISDSGASFIYCPLN